jgi:hypothetical protein
VPNFQRIDRQRKADRAQVLKKPRFDSTRLALLAILSSAKWTVETQKLLLANSPILSNRDIDEVAFQVIGK